MAMMIRSSEFSLVALPTDKVRTQSSTNIQQLNNNDRQVQLRGQSQSIFKCFFLEETTRFVLAQLVLVLRWIPPILVFEKGERSP